MAAMMHPVATLGEYTPSRYVHDPYAYPTPSRDSDESCSSDDGSVGPQECIAPLPVKKAFVAPAVAPAAPKRPRLSAEQRVELLTTAMTFLPLADIDIARKAGPVFEAAANRVAPQPLGTDRVAFVRWEPQELHTALPTPKPARRGATSAPAVFPWRCLACGTVTAGPRSCGNCRAPLATSACRVFLGQLRKDLSAELATAMVRSLAPDVTILHMESHTNGVDGRGKGCAWAYVNSVEDALRITALHKRVFVDLDAENSEGFWFVKDATLSAHLCGMADIIGSTRGRPVWLPRQPLVAELPSKSMLAEYVNSTRV